MMSVVRRWDRRGQSTLEYLLIAAVVIAAIATAATTLIQPAVSKTLKSSEGAINNAADKVAAGLQ